MRQTNRLTGVNTDPLQERPDLLAPIFEEFEQSENAETGALNDQPAKAEAFYQAERADNHSILNEMVSGATQQGVGFISGSQHAEAPEATSDGKATQLEESLSLIVAGCANP